MRKNLFSLFSALFLFSLFSSSQDQLRFNANGMLLAPPPHLKQGQNLSVIVADDGTLKQDTVLLRSKFSYIDTLLFGTTREEQLLINKLSSILNFFELDVVKKNCRISYLDTLKTNYGICLDQAELLSIVSKATETTTQTISTDCDTSCICLMVKFKIRELAGILNKLNDFKNRKQLIKELLCEEDTDSLFKFGPAGVQYLSGNFIQPAKRSFIPDIIPAGYRYKIGDSTLNYKQEKTGNTYTTQFTAPAKFETTLTRTKLLQQTLLKWHNDKINIFPSGYVDMLTKMVASDKDSIGKYAFAALCSKNCDASNLQTLFTYLNKYDSVWCIGSPLHSWLKSWLWYSNGTFRLNYLKVADPQALEARYKNDLAEMKNLDELYNKIETLKKCTTCNFLSLDTLKMLQDTAKSIEEKKARLGKGKTEMDQNLKEYNSLSQTKELLHSLKIPVGAPRKHHKVVYHDASAAYALANDQKLVLPDDRTVYLGFYNAKKEEDEKLKIDQVEEDFDDRSGFVQNMNAALSQLAEAVAPLAQYYLPFNTLTENLFGGFRPSLPLIDKTTPDSLTKLSCLQLRKKASYRLWQFQLLAAMLKEYNNLPAPSNIPYEQASPTSYFTYNKKADEWKAPYTNKYTVKYDDKNILVNRYSIGRQKSFTIGAGIFFNRKTARQVLVDTNANGFSIKNTDNKSKFVVGIKIFPFKAFEADDNLIPKHFAKRWSFFTGFEITKPLHNLYAGIGYDLVPGLHISYGAHIYKRTTYKIANNRVTDSAVDYKVSGSYYGVTIDPAVLAGILKLLLTNK